MFAAALVRNPTAQSRLAQSLRGDLPLRVVDSCSDLLDLALAAGASIVIAEPTDRYAKATWPVVAEIRRSFPRLPVLAYCTVRASLSEDLVDLVRAGAHDVVLLDVDDTDVGLRAKLGKARAIGTAEWAWSELEGLVPREVAPFLHYCLVNAFRPIEVTEVAAVLGVHRKTLVNRCNRAGVPQPGNLVSWCRVLMAARVMEDPGRAVEHLAMELGFPSAGALRALLKRYVGCNPQELRKAGGAPFVLAALKRTLSGEPELMHDLDLLPMRADRSVRDANVA